MKRIFIKIISFILLTVVVFSAVSCAKAPMIDDEGMDWNLVFITYKSATNVVYCAAEYKLNYPEVDVEIVDISCRAANGKLLIMNDKTDIGYYGTYTLDDGKDSYYEITVSTDDGVSTGHAEVAKAILHDDTVEYNLIIVIDGYTLHFKSLDD